MTTLLHETRRLEAWRDLPLDGAGGRRPNPSDSVVIGVSGANRNAAAALSVGGQLRGFCEQERLTRVRGAGLRTGELPLEAIQALLGMDGRRVAEVTAYAIAENDIALQPDLPRVRLDHHHSHAATAFLTSPFRTAAVLVVDRGSSPDVSVWMARGDQIVNQYWPWSGCGFAALYSQCLQVFGFAPGQEHRLEALARLDRGDSSARIAHLFAYQNGRLVVQPDWQRELADWLHEEGQAWPIRLGAQVASAFQRALGDALVALVTDIARTLQVPRLCLGGGLFYNTFLNSRIARSRAFDEVYVPPNPGNAGIAAGAALAVGRHDRAESPEVVSPFLGPEYGIEAVKATLDNCKLSPECLSEQETIGRCAEALAAGRLVGWFHGRMEWGHRALGNRSILASPLSPYALDNLNGFLKQRERHRAYGLSTCEEDAASYFEGPSRSSWMEYDYAIRDRDLFRHVLPEGASTLRVQTIDRGPSLFRELHAAFKAISGTGVLVNTSFNGFSEPIVCSPRDAVRVFYGTGLDVLVLGRFLLSK